MSAIFRGLFLLLLICASGTQAADTGWVTSPQNDHARIRLRAMQTNETVDALLYVQLTPGWKTYWRSPGEAGVAPHITWAETMAEQWFWPVPSRFDVSGLSTQGYHGQVIIPIQIKSTDSRVLEGTLSLPTCSNVCMVSDYPFSLDLKEESDPYFAEDYAQAMSGVPSNETSTESVSASWASGQLRIEAHKSEGWDNPQAFFDPLKGNAFPGNPTIRIEGEQLTLHVPVVDEWGDAPDIQNGDTLSFVLVDKGIGHEVKTQIGLSPPQMRTPSSIVNDEPALWRILLLAFTGGILLNLMPCVLPVLGMKLGFILNVAGDRKRIRLRFLATTLGILTSFAALALFISMLKLSHGGYGWGIQFQSKGFIAFLTLVTFAFALNFMGIFQFRLPSALTNKLAVAGGQGTVGSFCEGAFATLLATPCSAPFMGTAIAYAFSASLPVLWIVFMALGLGMSVPWLLVALFPRSILILPKPGGWMNTLRIMLGILLLGSSIWLASLLDGYFSNGLIPVLILFMLLIAMFSVLRSQVQKSKAVWLIVFGLAMSSGYQINNIVNVTGNNAQDRNAKGIQWQPLSEKAITTALSNGKAVFVDVTADWCITCKLNDARVFRQQDIISALNSPDIVALKGDWSQPSDEITQFLQKRNSAAIPFNQIYGKGNEQGILLPPLLNKKTVLEKINEAKGM